MQNIDILKLEYLEHSSNVRALFLKENKIAYSHGNGFYRIKDISKQLPVMRPILDLDPPIVKKEDSEAESEESEESEDEPEPVPKKREVVTYFTADMYRWLDNRLQVWLTIYAKWQIYFIAKKVREGIVPAQNTQDRIFYDVDMKASAKTMKRKHEKKFKFDVLTANPRMLEKQLKENVIPGFKERFVDQVPEELRKSNFPLNRTGRFKDGPLGFYDDFFENCESIFAEKHVYRWLLDSTTELNRTIALNLAKRTVELMGPKAWLQAFDFPNRLKIGLGYQRVGTHENPDHINNQQRLLLCDSLLKFGSAYQGSSNLLKDLSNFSIHKLRRNFLQNQLMFLPYLVFSTKNGNTMATKATMWVFVHHNHVLKQLGFTRFHSTEVKPAVMVHHWDEIEWDMRMEMYCLLFAAWDEAKAYANSLEYVQDGKLVSKWHGEGKYHRMNQLFPIDSKTITEHICAAEQGMPHIEHGEDARTVTSELSMVCQRRVGSVIDYEDTHTELESDEEVVVSEEEVVGSDLEQPSEDEPLSSVDEEDEIIDFTIPDSTHIAVFQGEHPQARKERDARHEAFELTQIKEEKDSGMGMAMAAAAVFLVLAFAISQ
mgnify:CR=1 FL=1